MATKSLKGKRILITAGPTWIPVDRVRVLSNTASGQIGIELAEAARKKGAIVTLLFGPGSARPLLQQKNIRVVPFTYFDEFDKLLKRELKYHPYASVIHAAAVADYRPIRLLYGKLRSDIGIFSLMLKPTPKIIDAIKKIRPGIFLVAFKLEFNVIKKLLVERALRTLQRCHADLVVANTVSPRRYEAYVVSPEGKTLASALSRRDIAQKLIKIITARL